MSEPMLWAAIATVALIAIAAIGYSMQRRRNSVAFRSKFGSAYDDTVK